jgi:hypothetical protein
MSYKNVGSKSYEYVLGLQTFFMLNEARKKVINSDNK